MNAGIHWDAVTAETVHNLSRLIQAKTVNPPGNEMPAIMVVKDILEREGFLHENYKIVESAPGRANLVARLRGDGSLRPLLITGHLDVVPVEADYWSRDPFGGEVADGCVWGRGALDMKGAFAMYLQIFLLAYRRNLPLKRDLILAAIADEEAGFGHGSKYLVDHHRELIDAEFAINEGGAMTLHIGGARLYPIQVGEKGVCWMRMTTRGKPGHGSLPHDDNAVFQLCRALDRLRRAGHLPVHITPTVEAMLDATANQISFPLGLSFRLLRNPTLARVLLNLLPPETRGILVALLSNSVSPTILKAGTKTNVIPSTAVAHIDCRLLPGQRSEDAIREILAITGDQVELEVISISNGSEFPRDTPLYHLMERATKEMDPKGIVFPMLNPGATDAVEYKRAGIIVYGFTPGVFPEDFPLLELIHGHDERYPVSAIHSGLRALWRVVSEFCCE